MFLAASRGRSGIDFPETIDSKERCDDTWLSSIAASDKESVDNILKVVYRVSRNVRKKITYQARRRVRDAKRKRFSHELDTPQLMSF